MVEDVVVDWTLRYDRCVGADFLDLLRPGGVAYPTRSRPA
jgi:hypothetical protein